MNQKSNFHPSWSIRNLVRLQQQQKCAILCKLGEVPFGASQEMPTLRICLGNCGRDVQQTWRAKSVSSKRNCRMPFTATKKFLFPKSVNTCQKRFPKQKWHGKLKKQGKNCLTLILLNLPGRKP